MFKKILSLVLILGLIASPLYAADKWLEGDGSLAIAGGDSPADIDTLLDDSIAQPLDRLLDAYKTDAVVLYASASTLTVTAGTVVVEDSSGVHRMRENTSSTTVTWSDIDTDAETSSTYYYVYAIGDADAATFTVTISTSSTAPTGVTYYKKIGWFYNNSSSNIIEVGNVPTAGSPNIVKAVGTSDISTSAPAYADMDDMIIYFVSHGRPVKVFFQASTSNGANSTGYITIDIDGTDKIAASHNTGTYDVGNSTVLFWLEDLSAGTHTIKAQWKSSSSTFYQYGTTKTERILIVQEL